MAREPARAAAFATGWMSRLRVDVGAGVEEEADHLDVLLRDRDGDG